MRMEALWAQTSSNNELLLHSVLETHLLVWDKYNFLLPHKQEPRQAVCQLNF